MTFEWKSRVLPPFQKTLISQCTPDTPDSHALTRRSPPGSTENTMAGMTALWHLERKPPIPVSTCQEALHCFASSRRERTSCLHTTRDLTPLLKLQRNPEIYVSTGEET